ncbi:sodium:calcium antiporter [Nonomuraea sp. NPDC050451]|uniref:sodium:calcium antiporter n=1 Tax=Nonomuraea sp. NPDC050451 TaxID=3364364 RepID=UPI0037A017C3
MLLLIALIALGLVILAFAGDHLVLGSGRLAGRLGLQPVVVGVMVMGLAASLPELIMAATASLRGHEELATASLVGSNILNVTAVLGVGGLIAALAIRSSLLQREALLSMAAVTIFAITLLDGLGPGAGVTLAVALIGAMVLLVVLVRMSPHDMVAVQSAGYLNTAVPPRLGREVSRTLAGLAGVLVAAQLLVVNASDLATQVGASPDLVGFTLVAFAAALPILIIAIRAQRQGYSDLLVGTLLGGNLITSLAGGAIVALLTAGAPTVTSTVIVAMVGIIGFIWALLARGIPLSRSPSALLVVAYFLVLLLLR